MEDTVTPTPPKPNNGPAAALNWPTVVLILLTGGGNFFATQQNSSQRQYEQERAHQQIAELHAALDDFEGRQKQELAQIAEVLKNQNTLLGNQSRVLEELRRGPTPGK
jgi:hypothetical protein